MGCGCKNKKVDIINSDEVKKYNFKDKLARIGVMILSILFLLCLSPFLLMIIWYISFKSIIGSETDIVNNVLALFKYKLAFKKNKDDNDLGNLSNDELEIVGVEVIK